MRTPPLPRLPTVVVVIAATVALIASFRNTPHVQKGRLATVQPRTAPAPTPTPPARTRSQTTRKRPAPAAARRVTGSVIMTAYGPVQVRIKVRGSRILSIDNLALPFDRNRSQEISSIAGPLLRTEALRAQSARIDVVSGATYTSDGYAQSLQSALDRAHA
jgi:uncharacterized protein with FMN-binding domain